MKALIKQDFDYSADGVTIRRLKAGETREISESLFPGLRAAGFVSEAPKETPEPPPVVRSENAPRPHFDDRRRQGRR